MAEADPKLATLLELERRGALTPAASDMLKAYRAQGVTKTKPLGAGGQPVGPGVDNPDVLETKSNRDKARGSVDRLGLVAEQLARVRQLYNDSLRGSGPIKSIREFLPSQANSQFDNAVQTLATLVRPTTRVEGEGSMSDYESKLANAPLPNRWKFDGANEESLRGLERIVSEGKSNTAKRLGLPKPPPAAKTSSGWTIQEH